MSNSQESLASEFLVIVEFFDFLILLCDKRIKVYVYNSECLSLTDFFVNKTHVLTDFSPHFLYEALPDRDV